MKKYKKPILITLALFFSSFNAHAEIVCIGGYRSAHESGQKELSERNLRNIERTLINNKPNVDGFGACLEAFNLSSRLGGLLTPSTYVNVASINGILNFVQDRVINGICSEILDEAQESFGLISDVVEGEEASIVIEDFEVGNAGVGADL